MQFLANVSFVKVKVCAQCEGIGLTVIMIWLSMNNVYVVSSYLALSH